MLANARLSKNSFVNISDRLFHMDLLQVPVLHVSDGREESLSREVARDLPSHKDERYLVCKDK